MYSIDENLRIVVQYFILTKIKHCHFIFIVSLLRNINKQKWSILSSPNQIFYDLSALCISYTNMYEEGYLKWTEHEPGLCN